MLDQLTDENFRDFNARYSHTYGFIDVKGTKRLVFITDVSEEEVFFRTTRDGIIHNVHRNSGVTFEFTQIDRGFYPGSDGAVYHMHRIPARQWKRGISRQNTSLSKLQNGNWSIIDITVDCLRTVLTEHKHTITATPDSTDFVLSRYFAVSGGLLWFMRSQIGVVGADKVITLDDFGMFVKQELQDSINRTGFNAWLKLKQQKKKSSKAISAGF